MIGDDWILGWIVDGLAKRFGPVAASWLIVLALPLTLIILGIVSAIRWMGQG
jgi:hypothetical protein